MGNEPLLNSMHKRLRSATAKMFYRTELGTMLLAFVVQKFQASEVSEVLSCGGSAASCDRGIYVLRLEIIRAWARDHRTRDGF